MDLSIDSPYHSSSLVESRLEKFSRENPSSLILQTTWRILRTYPGGFRQDSSNPNPVKAWNFGIQMAALNYQNEDQQMALCHGKFLDNGSCGYVLKPQYLIDLDKSHFNPIDYLSKPIKSPDYPQRLILTIISGQFFSRSNGDADDIPDPYVIVSTHGISCDQKVFRTRFIENNGLNPRWDETFTFDIHFPQMCLVRFDVYDYDVFSRDDRLAYFCLPLPLMQTGILPFFGVNESI